MGAEAAAGRAIPEVIHADGFPEVFHTFDTATPRGRIAAWASLRISEPGITNKEIAARLRINPKTLSRTIYNATAEGWLVFDDPLDQIEYETIPKVVRNLNKFLDEGDKQVTIEAAKGTIFKSYQDSKGISEGINTVLSLKLETPAGDISVMSGKVVGRPKMDIEVVDVGKESN